MVLDDGVSAVNLSEWWMAFVCLCILLQLYVLVKRKNGNKFSFFTSPLIRTAYMMMVKEQHTTIERVDSNAINRNTRIHIQSYVYVVRVRSFIASCVFFSLQYLSQLRRQRCRL